MRADRAARLRSWWLSAINEDALKAPLLTSHASSQNPSKGHGARSKRRRAENIKHNGVRPPSMSRVEPTATWSIIAFATCA